MLPRRSPQRRQRQWRREAETLDLSSKPTPWLPALADGLRIHAVLLPAFVLPVKHENRPDSLVGRLH